jgi:transposase
MERLFAKAKAFRRVAIRYEERKRMYLGWVHLVLAVIRLRAKTKQEQAKKTNVNTA